MGLLVENVKFCHNYSFFLIPYSFELLEGNALDQAKNKQDNWKRRFIPFWVSQMVSIFGSELVQFSLVWWLTRETGSATVLATASMFALIPKIVMMPFAGAIVDRVNRKMVIIIADGIIALATLGLGVLFFMDRVEVWFIYVIMLIRSLGSAFHFPAEQASVALMVPEAHLGRIAGINQAAQGIINIVAAPVGALILETMGAEGSLMIDVVTAAIAIGIVAFISIPKQDRLEEQGKTWFGTILRDMRDGFNYLVNWKALLAFTLMALVFKMALTPAFSLLPLFVFDHLNGTATQYSLVDVAAGVGFILGGLMLGVWGGFKKHLNTIAVGGFGVGLSIFLIGCIPAGKFTWILPPAFLVGLAIPIVDGPLSAVLQEKVENQYQGRVMTLFGSIVNLSGPIGLAVAGPAADAFGLQALYIFTGILIFLCMGFGFFSKDLRRLDQGPGEQ
jgi:MFS transporter, DHA3 family, macrolide efflux protein